MMKAFCLSAVGYAGKYARKNSPPMTDIFCFERYTFSGELRLALRAVIMKAWLRFST